MSNPLIRAPRRPVLDVRDTPQEAPDNASEREVVDAHRAQRSDRRFRDRREQPQHGRAAHRDLQPRGQAGARTAGQDGRHRFQRPGQQSGPSLVAAGQLRDLLAEGASRTVASSAGHPADGQCDDHFTTADRHVAQPPHVATVNASRQHPA
jgi:hypothetical protein